MCILELIWQISDWIEVDIYPKVRQDEDSSNFEGEFRDGRKVKN